MAGGRRRGLAFAALGFALAAAFSAWNPVAAPFGLVVGAASSLVALRALARPDGRRIAWTALGISLAAIAGSLAVLALGAGLGRGGPGEALVPVKAADEVARELDQAAESTRESRERARRELERLDGGGTK